jgi:hypothetical protein
MTAIAQPCRDLPLGARPSEVRAFTPIEVLRALVLLHDGDAAFLAANRHVIGAFAAGESSLEAALWNAARDLVAVATFPIEQEPR